MDILCYTASVVVALTFMVCMMLLFLILSSLYILLLSTRNGSLEQSVFCPDVYSVGSSCKHVSSLTMTWQVSCFLFLDITFYCNIELTAPINVLLFNLSLFLLTCFPQINLIFFTLEQDYLVVIYIMLYCQRWKNPCHATIPAIISLLHLDKF